VAAQVELEVGAAELAVARLRSARRATALMRASSSAKAKGFTR
jgi:hypothetical protein